MKTLPLVLVALSLSACSALQTAGVADYSVKPIVIGKETVCCEVSVKNGKEYASLKARITKTGNDYSVELEEQAVQAFAGQQKAADVVTKAVETAGTLGASAIAAPAVGTALGTGVKLIAQ